MRVLSVASVRPASEHHAAGSSNICVHACTCMHARMRTLLPASCPAAGPQGLRHAGGAQDAELPDLAALVLIRRSGRWRRRTSSAPSSAATSTSPTSTPSPPCCCWASTPQARALTMQGLFLGGGSWVMPGCAPAHVIPHLPEFCMHACTGRASFCLASWCIMKACVVAHWSTESRESDTGLMI
jgi:hypothetical protein